MDVPGNDEITELVEREPSEPTDEPSVVGWLQRMCRTAARDLPASGVGVSLLSEEGALLTVAASSAASAAIEDLQFTLGEGPCLAAHETRSPVLVPDLSARATTTWPGYAAAAGEHGVKAVFAFPLQVGAARLGALDVYREQTGPLSAKATSRALSYAGVATLRLLDGDHPIERAVGSLGEGNGTRFQVYQAQGMVMVQLRVSAAEAMARLRAHAYATGRELAAVADDVVARRLVLESDDRPDGSPSRPRGWQP